METDKIYRGATDTEVWSQLAADINDETLEYHARIDHAGQTILLDIDIDPGGGFEGGYATTSYSAPIDNKGFKFAIHEEHFIDEIGKFFGMQDVKTGYDDLDHHLIIKTNDEDKVKALFADEKTRKVFTDLSYFDFGIHLHDVDGNDEAFLELNIEDGITNTNVLHKLYNAFYAVIKAI